ncbi:MAG: enoyl-CoA hydratase/isomerase [Hyphomonadaceae bacterium]
MAFEKITYKLDGDIAVIAFNDPATLNAAGLDVVSELISAFDMAAGEARCVILTGTGRGFCSGANLSAGGSAPRTRAPDIGSGLDSHYHPLIMAMKELPCPIVSAVNGVAAGIGCSIALMGDMIIAGESASFLQAFRRIGLVPDGGSTWILPRLIGRARAMEMVLLGEKISPAKALEWGLINQVTTDDDLMNTAMELAGRLASGPTTALALGRSLVWEGADRNFEAQLHAERTAQRTAGRTKDVAEGIKAFLEKRPAKFTGK